MRLGQIVKRALEQAGEDAADLEEYRDQLTGYVNEGYHRMIREAYRPMRRAVLTVEDGTISTASLRGAIEVRSVKQDGRTIRFDYLPFERALLLSGAKDGADAAVEYTHDEDDMTDAEEEPRLPETAHGALADYGTYRFLLNGNLNKQQRAQAYLQHYMLALRAIQPFGRQGGGVKRWTGLYEATRG